MPTFPSLRDATNRSPNGEGNWGQGTPAAFTRGGARKRRSQPGSRAQAQRFRCSPPRPHRAAADPLPPKWDPPCCPLPVLAPLALTSHGLPTDPAPQLPAPPPTPPRPTSTNPCLPHTAPPQAPAPPPTSLMSPTGPPPNPDPFRPPHLPPGSGQPGPPRTGSGSGGPARTRAGAWPAKGGVRKRRPGGGG